MNFVEKLTVATLATLCLIPIRAHPAAAQVDGAATADSVAVVNAALDWVEMLDEGKTAAALENAAALLRGMVGSAQQWEQFVQMARAEFPTTVKRELIFYETEPNLPAAPAGSYRRVAFLIGDDPGITETVVMTRTDSGWKAAMYGVR